MRTHNPAPYSDTHVLEKLQKSFLLSLGSKYLAAESCLYAETAQFIFNKECVSGQKFNP
jgi:hypothetical protein